MSEFNMYPYQKQLTQEQVKALAAKLRKWGMWPYNKGLDEMEDETVFQTNVSAVSNKHAAVSHPQE